MTRVNYSDVEWTDIKGHMWHAYIASALHGMDLVLGDLTDDDVKILRQSFEEFFEQHRNAAVLVEVN